MSYFINATSIDFTIPAKNLPAALATMKSLNSDPDYQHRKHGHTSESHFRYMPADYDQTVTSAAEVFHLLGFTTATAGAGLALTGHQGNLGPQEDFLGAVAHLVTPGSYIEWHLDDGDDVPMRFEFDGQHLHTP